MDVSHFATEWSKARNLHMRTAGSVGTVQTRRCFENPN